MNPHQILNHSVFQREIPWTVTNQTSAEQVTQSSPSPLVPQEIVPPEQTPSAEHKEKELEVSKIPPPSQKLEPTPKPSVPLDPFAPEVDVRRSNRIRERKLKNHVCLLNTEQCRTPGSFAFLNLGVGCVPCQFLNQ